MIGNDIVDLGDPDSAVAMHHARFDERVFAPEERELLRTSMDAERLRWSLWAAKESAYKLLRRASESLVFAPARFVVRPRGAAAATVDAAGTSVGVDLEMSSRFVHAIARRCGTGSVQGCSAVSDAAGPESASELARRLALAHVARSLGEDVTLLSIVRERRAPVLLLRGRRLPGALSLSHHGRFVAFAWTAPYAA